MSKEQDYAALLGMRVKHKTYGLGVISSTYVNCGILYFKAKFDDHPEEKKFEAALLGGRSGYFSDIAPEILARGMIFPPPMIEREPDQASDLVVSDLRNNKAPYKYFDLTCHELYQDLIGMEVRHKQLGFGVISTVFVERQTLYFTLKLLHHLEIRKFRVDLLGGWGGFFFDISDKILAKGMPFPPRPIVNSRGVESCDHIGAADDDASYRELLDEADSDNWAHYYSEETGWYEP